MTPLLRGLVVAMVQIALVASLGAKLLYDRAVLPRVWVRTAPYDPDLPIRGRYVRLQIVVDPTGLDGGPGEDESSLRAADLHVEDGRLVAEIVPVARAENAGYLRVRLIRSGGEKLTVLDTPVAFFIPEDASDPSQRPAGEQLWVEATIPHRGPPRPIRLGVKKGDGPIVPLGLR